MDIINEVIRMWNESPFMVVLIFAVIILVNLIILSLYAAVISNIVIDQIKRRNVKQHREMMNEIMDYIDNRTAQQISAVLQANKAGTEQPPIFASGKTN